MKILTIAKQLTLLTVAIATTCSADRIVRLRWTSRPTYRVISVLDRGSNIYAEEMVKHYLRRVVDSIYDTASLRAMCGIVGLSCLVAYCCASQDTYQKEVIIVEDWTPEREIVVIERYPEEQQIYIV